MYHFGSISLANFVKINYLGVAVALKTFPYNRNHFSLSQFHCTVAIVICVGLVLQ